ncbi:DNA repair protein RadA [Candidatus Collierbacteria bacterium]|nr:DNA repair protein RadA [Candidatus Collierbacteria bacterium]
MSKNEIFLCNNCGNEFTKWSGKCQACGQWNSLTQVTSLAYPKSKQKNIFRSAKTAVLTPSKALTEAQAFTFPTKLTELDRVLGPGLTKGGVYLIAGQPGIGKSTLLTQLAISISPQPPLKLRGGEGGDTVLYVCSEENPAQVATRISRLNTTPSDHVHLLNTSSVEVIISSLSLNSYSLVIVDSIQSVFTDKNPTTAGSPSQIRDSANLLIQTAKETNTPVILVGHVTKEGTIAGPKLLEHMVDTVMELTGDRQHELRLLRGLKNRFGPTDETGIFRMTSLGLEEVSDPSRFLLADRQGDIPGSALALIMEGTRPITAEVQALVSPTTIPIPRRVAKGISTAQLQLICAIVSKHLKIPLSEKDVFVNVTGGISLKEPGADLAIALAIISSAKNKPLPKNSICFGELGLLGEIRRVSFQDKRIKEAKALGYQSIISPASHKHLKQVIF